jgi:hypothetical protein
MEFPMAKSESKPVVKKPESVKAVALCDCMADEGEFQQCWGVAFQSINGELVAELKAADYELMKSAGRVK